MDPWDEWPCYYTEEIMQEQIVPSSWWTQTDDSHSLFIHVPGFNEDEVKLRIHTNGSVITVSGERRANEDNKIIRFEQSYVVPNDSNIEMASGPFKDDVFSINIPKKVPFPKSHNPANHCGEPPTTCGYEEESFEKEESNVMKKMLKRVMKNKMEILRVVIAFSIGVIVAHKRGKAEVILDEVTDPKTVNM